MAVIGYVRHGVTDWNALGRIQGQTNIELNEQGKQQARLLAQRLRSERWDKIYTSDLMRAYETAQIINEALDVELVEDVRLREVHFGLIEGTTLEERIEKWGTNWRELDLGKEKQSMIDERVSSIVNELSETHAGQRILLVTHGAWIVNSLKYFIPEIDTTERIENASLTIIEQIDGQWTCTLYNSTAHLR